MKGNYKRGAPKGNKNAKGTIGGPGSLFGNTNAVKFGEYENGVYRLLLDDYVKRVGIIS